MKNMCRTSVVAVLALMTIASGGATKAATYTFNDPGWANRVQSTPVLATYLNSLFNPFNLSPIRFEQAWCGLVRLRLYRSGQQTRQVAPTRAFVLLILVSGTTAGTVNSPSLAQCSRRRLGTSVLLTSTAETSCNGAAATGSITSRTAARRD